MRITRSGHIAIAIAVVIGSLGLACSSSPSGPTAPVGGGTRQAAAAADRSDGRRCSPPATSACAAGRRSHRPLAWSPASMAMCCSPAIIAYFQGTAENFRDCFNPSWGQFRSRWHPVPGNHEYESAGAAPYFAYFGAAAGPAGLGYYAFTAGDWLILMLNSNIPATRGSPQWEFARARARAAANAVHDGGLASPAVLVRPERHRTEQCATCGRCSKRTTRR